METARTFETVVSYYITTQRQSPEDRDLNLHHYEKFTSRKRTVYLNLSVKTETY